MHFSCNFNQNTCLCIIPTFTHPCLRWRMLSLPPSLPHTHTHKHHPCRSQVAHVGKVQKCVLGLWRRCACRLAFYLMQCNPRIKMLIIWPDATQIPYDCIFVFVSAFPGRVCVCVCARARDVTEGRDWTRRWDHSAKQGRHM